MPVIYEKADAGVIELITATAEKYHGELTKAEVHVICLMATAAKDDNGEPLSPALKLHGVECAALAKIVSYKDRVAGGADVQILIDADKWKDATDAQRVSLVDHELNHFAIQYDDEGNVKSDDHGRPKIKMRPHDIDAGWFHAIAQRHGDASCEVRQAKAFAEEQGQLYFGWALPPPPGSIEAQQPERELKAMKLTVQMTEVRNALRDRLGAEYLALTNAQRQAIKKKAATNGGNYLKAAIELAKQEPSESVQIALTAAAVDLCEKS